jgi:hypothetical protein
VAAIADALIKRKTLTGDEIDAIIAGALACDGLDREKARHAEWARCIAQAAAFESCLANPQ